MGAGEGCARVCWDNWVLGRVGDRKCGLYEEWLLQDMLLEARLRWVLNRGGAGEGACWGARVVQGRDRLHNFPI